MSTDNRSHRSRRGWDPGSPRGIRPLGASLFLAQSFREDGKQYLVDLSQSTCACDHFQKKLLPDAEAAGLPPRDCKHLRAVREFTTRRVLPAPRRLLAADLFGAVLRHQGLHEKVRDPLLLLLACAVHLERQGHGVLEWVEKIARTFRERGDLR